MTEPLACYRVISKILDQDPHTAHHSILRSLPVQLISCFSFTKVSLATCKVQQLLLDQVAGGGRLQEGESRQLEERDAQIELPTNQEGRSRGAEGRRKGKEGREGEGEES